MWLGSFAEGGTALGTLAVTEDLSRSPAGPVLSAAGYSSSERQHVRI
jgi:hypothetical protein